MTDYTWKPDQGITCHRDGSVSYFSVIDQQWRRQPSFQIPPMDLAALTSDDRGRIGQSITRGCARG